MERGRVIQLKERVRKGKSKSIYVDFETYETLRRISLIFDLTMSGAVKKTVESFKNNVKKGL